MCWCAGHGHAVRQPAGGAGPRGCAARDQQIRASVSSAVLLRCGLALRAQETAAHLVPLYT